jgi:hypothetical protein
MLLLPVLHRPNLKELEDTFYDLSTFARGGDEMSLEGVGLLEAVKAAKPDILIGSAITVDTPT